MDIEGLLQDCSISIANALEILQSCTKPSIRYRHLKSIIEDDKTLPILQSIPCLLMTWQHKEPANQQAWWLIQNILEYSSIPSNRHGMSSVYIITMKAPDHHSHGTGPLCLKMENPTAKHTKHMENVPSAKLPQMRMRSWGNGPNLSSTPIWPGCPLLGCYQCHQPIVLGSLWWRLWSIAIN